MKTKEAIQWFKNTFNKHLEAAVAGTPFSVDMLAAIAQAGDRLHLGASGGQEIEYGKGPSRCVVVTPSTPIRAATPFPRQNPIF